MKNYNQHIINCIITGQILGDAFLEKVGTNARLTFSFGSKISNYANWILTIFQPFCSNNKGVYEVRTIYINKEYIQYRLKTRTNTLFTNFHNKFYQIENGRYRKIVPHDVKVCPVVLAHFIIGDGNYSKEGRIRIFTNNYTYDECVILSKSIYVYSGVKCTVVLDRVNKKGIKQYILNFNKTQVQVLQNKVKPYLCNTIYYRVGLYY